MKVTTLRMPEKLYDQIKRAAEDEERSVTKYILIALRERLGKKNSRSLRSQNDDSLSSDKISS